MMALIRSILNGFHRSSSGGFPNLFLQTRRRGPDFEMGLQFMVVIFETEEVRLSEQPSLSRRTLLLQLAHVNEIFSGRWSISANVNPAA